MDRFTLLNLMASEWRDLARRVHAVTSGAVSIRVAAVFTTVMTVVWLAFALSVHAIARWAVNVLLAFGVAPALHFLCVGQLRHLDDIRDKRRFDILAFAIAGLRVT